MNEMRSRLGNLANMLLAAFRVLRDSLLVRLDSWRTGLGSLRGRDGWRSVWRGALPLLAYAVAWILGLHVASALAFALSPKVEGPVPLYLTGPVTVSALLLIPPRRWWGVLLLTLPLIPLDFWFLGLPNTAAVREVIVFVYLIIVCISVVSVSLIRRYLVLPLRFASVGEVGCFVGCIAAGAVPAILIAASARALVFSWNFLLSWQMGYLGYVLGIAVFTPAIVLWLTQGLRGLGLTSRQRQVEVSLLLLATVVVSGGVFGTRLPEQLVAHTLIYGLVPMLIWAAVRFGPQGLASILALGTTLAVIGAVNNRGPFVGSSATVNTLALQLFLLFVGVPLFFLAALVQERKQADEALRASEFLYRTVMRNLPHTAVLLFDAELRHRFAEGPGLALVGLTPQGVEGHTLREAFPADLVAALALTYGAALSSQPRELDVDHGQQTFHVEVVPLPGVTTGPEVSGDVAPAAAGSAPVGMMVLEDVTEQRHARDDLERQRLLAASLSSLTQEFRTLAEHSPDVIVRLDWSGRIRYVNAAGAALLGQSAGYWIGKTVADVGVPETATSRWAERLREVVATGAPATFDETVAASDGQIHPMHVRLVPELAEGAEDGEEGTLQSVLVIATDISALKQAEARLAAQASELETIFESQADGVTVFDLAGRYMRTNRALRVLLGFDADAEYTSLPIEERAQRLRLYDEDGQLLPLEQWPQWRVLRGEIFAGASAMEVGVRTLDGRDRWMSITGAPLRAPDGQATGVVLIARDVTVRRALERQVAEQASQLEAIFDAIADGIGVFDLQGRYLRANPALRQMEGFSADAEYITRPLAERAQRLLLFDEQGHRLAADQWPQWRALRGEIFAGANALEVRIRTLDGREIWASVTGAPVRASDGQITGCVLILRDVAARRALEQRAAAQASELVAIFEAQADGVLVYDKDGRMVRANRAWQTMFQKFTGLTDLSSDPTFVTLPFAEQVERWHESVRSDQYPLRDAQLHPIPLEQTPTYRALRGETVTGAEAVDEGFEGVDGHVDVMSVSAAPIQDVEGNIVGAVGVAREVTAQRQLERQVREQAAQLEAIFAAMTDAVFMLDMQGHIVRMNPAGWRFLGRTPGETFAPTPEERARELQIHDSAGHPLLAEHLPINRMLRGEVLGGENIPTLRLGSHTDHPRTVNMTGGPLRDEASGRIVGAVGVVRDVTELQRVQAALAEQERLFRTLVEHSPDIIARFDRQQRYLYVNPAIRHVSPLPEGAYAGKTNAELGFPEAAYAPAQRAIEQAFQTGQPQIVEESDAPYRDNPDTIRYMRAQFLPERSEDGRVESVLTVTTDITPLKRTEQALREAIARLEIARQEETRRKQIAESLRGVLAILNSTRAPREVLQYIVHQAVQLLGGAAAAIYGPPSLTNSMPPRVPASPDAGVAPASTLAETLQVQAVEGLRIGGRKPRPNQRLPFAHAAVEKVLTSAQPVAVVNGQIGAGHPARARSASERAEVPGEAAAVEAVVALARLAGELPTPYQAMLVVPISIHDGIYGCLLLWYAHSHDFAAEEVALAQAYADQVAQAITNARLQTHLEAEAAAAERNRLAQELHDTVKQDLYSASLVAQSLPAVWKTHQSAAEAALQDLHVTTQSAYAGLQALLLELHPAALAQLPLAESLGQLTAAMGTRVGVPIVLDVQEMDAQGGAIPEPPLPAAVKVACYRVAQEALMNVAKYAHAHAIHVRLRTTESKGLGRLQLEVVDDGRGFDPSSVPAGHFGLAIMRERAQSVGARVQIDSHTGQGTVVGMTWQSKRILVASKAAEHKVTEAVVGGGSS